MKKFENTFRAILKPKVWAVSILLTFFSSCIVVTNDYGPQGHDGRAYYGIDYDWNPPYSYWDNNSSLPNNPFFGEFYRSNSGTFNFEYFINPFDYWYGTYSLYINHGENGHPYGVAGNDGADTYLMLICNDDGFYFDGWEECDCYRQELDDGTIILERTEGLQKIKIVMRKTNISERPTSKKSKYNQH